MARKGWGRRARREPDPAPIETDPDSVDLSGDEHAWWADRDRLEGGIPEGSQGSSRRKGRRSTADPDPEPTAFEGYFSAASLFAPSTEEDVDPANYPYKVLGLSEDATWEAITAAYRSQARRHHPDHLAGATPEQRAASERRIRDLNIAYRELRHRRGR